MKNEFVDLMLTLLTVCAFTLVAFCCPTASRSSGNSSVSLCRRWKTLFKAPTWAQSKRSALSPSSARWAFM